LANKNHQIIELINELEQEKDNHSHTQNQLTNELVKVANLQQ
jgi:hypothetical protein